MGSALDLLKIKSCFNSICWVKSLTNILSKPYSTYRVKSLTLLKNESVLLICKNAFFAVCDKFKFFPYYCISLISFSGELLYVDEFLKRKLRVFKQPRRRRKLTTC